VKLLWLENVNHAVKDVNYTMPLAKQKPDS